MEERLYFYKLVSPYVSDVTKNCRLTISEIDSNFKTLKDFDIKTAEFVRDEKVLVLTRNNGEKIVVLLDDMTYDFSASTESSPSGDTLTITYDGKDGPQTVVFGNVVTTDNIQDVINDKVLYVITDGTLKGNGTMSSPLGIKGVEKTGFFAPVKRVIDLTNGGKLPKDAKPGDRYITIEIVDDYGKLYNGKGIEKISEHIETERKGWRIPTKGDWDALLNSMEPCEYQNHDSTDCHVELGKYAGKFLKSQCDWFGQDNCGCTPEKPTPCNSSSTCQDGCEDINDIDPTKPDEKIYNCRGIDKYGFTALPSGKGELDTIGKASFELFGEVGAFWTQTHINDDEGQDRYSKVFVHDKCTVSQAGICPDDFFSVRLVKDYDGTNFIGTEYIDGLVYETILFPASKQIWLATNFAQTEGYVTYDFDEDCYDKSLVEVLDVNGGVGVSTRKELYINEWNGEYWDKRILNEGDTITIETPCLEQSSIVEVCWEKENEEVCVEVELPPSDMNNQEFRVYTNGECDKVLKNTDELVTERVLKAIVPILEDEIEEREKADEELNEKIDAEIERATKAEAELAESIGGGISALTEAINNEIARATEAEEVLTEAIASEIDRATSAETALGEAIETEVERAVAKDEELTEEIETEVERAQAAEAALNEAIEAEAERAKAAESSLAESVNEEAERAQAAEAELNSKLINGGIDYTMSVNSGLTLESMTEGVNNVVIAFDGDFGSI